MRTPLFALACTLVIALPLEAQTPPGTSKAKASGAASATPPAKKAPEPKIEGMEVPRGELGYMGVAIVGGQFKITFYDRKKAPIAADVHRALLRWDPKYKQGQERVVLNLTEDGKALTAPKAIRPPHIFKLFITLMRKSETGEDKATETYTIDFRA
jgi:hypothetical protein